jgi:hypothetical protein
MARGVRLIVILLSLVGVPGAGRAAPLRCDLAITATPSTIPAGSRTAQIRIPASLSDVHLSASSGTASAPLSLGAGSLIADFTAAKDSPPLALVAAVGGSLCGYSVLRIVSTSVIPAAGVPVSLVVVEPAAVRADQDTDVLVYIFAVDERAAPLRGNAPVVRPGIGSVARVDPLGPGVWRARWRVPAGEASAARVEAHFGSETPVGASLARTPGAPSAIEVVRDPGSGGGEGGTPTSLLVRIRDSFGNLTDAPLEADSDVALVGTPVRLEPGVYRAPVVVPPGTQGDAFVVAARAGRAVATATFPIAASAAAVVRVGPYGPIRADSSTRGQFEIFDVTVLDAQGNPVSDVPVGSGGRGEFRGAIPVSPGHWALPYRPPAIKENTTERVVVTAGAASTTVDLDLVARRVRVWLGLKTGLAIAGGSLGPMVGAEAGAWTSFGRTQLGLVLDVNWWTLSRTSAATVGGADLAYKSTQGYVPILLSVAWRTPFADRWMLWATAGGGGGVVSTSAQLEGQPSVSESGFAPAASGSLSVGPRVGPGFLFLETRGTWIGDPKLSTWSGSSFTFLGLLGYRFDVG